jgi:hypothetical protein
MTTSPLQPLAFIYDRHPTGDAPDAVTARVGRCVERATELRWDIAGTWLDVGPAADAPAADRPELVRMLELMRRHESGRRVICVVASEDRLGADRAAAGAARRAIAFAGGSVETAGGTELMPAGLQPRGGYRVVERA